MVSIISIIIIVSYLILIGGFIYGFNKVDEFFIDDEKPKNKFSIVIPFRNEAENLPELLQSIKTLDFPKDFFEIIFVNDDSEDNSVEIIKKELVTKSATNDFNQTEILIINNERKTDSPKKDAITTAIHNAKYDWIITTDADCILPKYWLQSYDAYLQEYPKAKSIIAPVAYVNGKNFIERFQVMELLCLQGSTIGGFGVNNPFLCNGANFAYKKNVFKTVEGFKGNSTFASGDDVFLLEKIIKSFPKQLHYLKCIHAIVLTKAQPNWHQLISQRVRWASKTSAYKIMFGKLVGLIVFLANAMLVTLFLLSILNLFSFKTFGYLLILKFSIDFLLLYKSAVFFKQKEYLPSYIVSFFMYPIFSTYVAFLSIFSNYNWKGRQFKK